MLCVMPLRCALNAAVSVYNQMQTFSASKHKMLEAIDSLRCTAWLLVESVCGQCTVWLLVIAVVVGKEHCVAVHLMDVECCQ